MATNFWSDKAQFLLNAIRFKDGVSVNSLSQDPTSTATIANQNSIGLFDSNVYVKEDSGLTTNWVSLGKMSELAHLFSTGIIEGAVISDAGLGTIDITSAKAVHVNIDDPQNIIVEMVDIPAESGLAITDIATQEVTYLGYDFASGDYVQQATRFTQEQKRDIAVIGLVSHPTGTILTISPTNKIGLLNPTNSIDDLANAVGSVNLEGNIAGPVGANLNLGKTAGRIFKFQAAMDSNPKDPSDLTQPAIDTSVSGDFFEYYSDGSGGVSLVGPTSVIDPTIWDDGTGTLGTIGNNRWSVKTLYVGPVNNRLYVGVGTEDFASLNAARQGFLASPNRLSPDLTRDIHLIGYLFTKGSTTDLSDESDALFVRAGKFGSGTVGGGVTSVNNNRQETYDNSTDGVTVLTDAKPKIDRDASTPITGNIREVTSNDGSDVYWSVASTHNQITDNDGSFVVRSSIKYPFIQDFKVDSPSDVITVVSGGGTVQESSDIPAIPIVSGFRSALLNSTSSSVFELESIDTSHMSTMGRKVAIEFDCGYLSAGSDTYYAQVEYSTDDVTFSQIPDTGDTRILGPNTYSIPFEYDKETYPYLRLVIKSENIVLNSRISLDNYRLNSYLERKLNDEIVVTDTDLTATVNTTYVIEAGNGDAVVTLPDEHKAGDKITVKHLMDGNDEWVEVVASGADTIDGEASYFMYDSKESVTLISDGTDWYII